MGGWNLAFFSSPIFAECLACCRNITVRGEGRVIYLSCAGILRTTSLFLWLVVDRAGDRSVGRSLVGPSVRRLVGRVWSSVVAFVCVCFCVCSFLLLYFFFFFSFFSVCVRLPVTCSNLNVLTWKVYFAKKKKKNESCGVEIEKVLKYHIFFSTLF